MMVLKEEFFPLMEEVKNSVSLMSKGANGNAFFTKNIPKVPKSLVLIFVRIFWAVGLFSSFPSELLDCDDLHSVIRLVLKAGNYMNAVAIFPHYNYVPVTFLTDGC